MLFRSPLLPGRLIRRYKRFLADVYLLDGERVTAHCPDPGRMTGCQRPGAAVRVRHAPGPGRKLAYTLELVRVGNTWVGVNTTLANRVVEEALERRGIAELRNYRQIRREVRMGERRRVDFVLTGSPDCYLEVKSVTLAEGRRALFPDSVTKRGADHLRHLRAEVQAGHRAVLLYLVNRGDCDRVGVAAEIDPTYARELQRAIAAGVEVLAYRSRVSPSGITLARRLEFEA